MPDRCSTTIILHVAPSFHSALYVLSKSLEPTPSNSLGPDGRGQVLRKRKGKGRLYREKNGLLLTLRNYLSGFARDEWHIAWNSQ